MNAMGIALFIHVVSIATWLGGIALMAMYLRDATRSGNLETMSYALGKVQRWNLTMIIPTAVLALISGIYMWMAYAEKPFWLLVKERFGSLFVILFIVLVAFYGNKLLKQVKTNGTDTAKAQTLVKRYIMMLNISLLLLVVLVFFATVKIGN